jgi:hypothetical protein
VSLPFEPLPAFDCPLCGAANGCAVARRASFEVDCWCRRATPSPEALARVPPALRGKACLCPACLSRTAGPAAAPERAAEQP